MISLLNRVHNFGTKFPKLWVYRLIAVGCASSLKIQTCFNLVKIFKFSGYMFKFQNYSFGIPQTLEFLPRSKVVKPVVGVF
uniref:Uncharacterized protein n=1 Tax=Oryza brachyantha TaxID=4533 RepID=J3M9F8_ORYBR